MPSKKPRRTARIKPCQVSLVRRKCREERNCYGFKTYLDLARSDQVNTSESTVKRFFAAQERIDADVAKDICRVLKLEPPEEYLEGMGLEAISSSETLENSAQPVLQTYLEQLCREMLVQLQELTTNPLTGPGVSLKLDDIYFERGLQQLKAKPKCNSDFSTQPIQALGEGDEITPLTHQEFFDRVLELGQSPTSKGRLAITGEAGAGKTTLLQKIASKILENHLGFPIWIRLAQLRDRSLSEYLLTVWLPTANTNIKSEQLELFLKQQCLEGKVWLLLDELDKMPQPSRIVLIDSMEQGWVKAARMIITSRTEVWQIAQKGLPHFSVYRPVNFSASQLRQFISNWFKQIGSSEQGQGLLRRLENPRSEHIRDLSKNPLCCSLLCYAYGMGRGELPPTKAELYSDYVDSLYEWQQWKPEHPAETKPTRRELKQALGKLALRALEEGFTILKQDFIENHFAELDEPLFQLALKLNLIILLGIDPEQPRKNLYTFFHPTFQEYFAAGAIADKWHFFLNPVPGNPAAGSYRLFDSESKWLDVYFFWLGQPAVNRASKLSLLRALVAFEDECTDYNFYRLRGYFIAATGLPEFKDCPPSLADEIVGTIVKLSIGVFEAEHQLLRWSDHLIAESARTALLWTDAKRAVDLLVPNLSLIVEKENLQKDIAEILGEIGIGNSRAIQALSQLLLRNPDEETKRIWVECLGKIGIGDSNAICTLTQLFYQSFDETTRLKIAQTLIEVDPSNESACAFLLDRVPSESRHSSRLAGVNNLTSCTSAINRVFCQSLKLELLIFKMRNPVSHVLLRMGQDLSNQIITNLLIERLNNATDDSIRLKFATLLSLINPKEALSYLQNLLTSQAEEIRLEAACTLQEIWPNNFQVIQTLNNLLNCKNDWLVYRAATRLEAINLGSINAQKAFNKLLNSKETEIVLIMAKQWRKIKVSPSQLVNILFEIVRGRKNEDERKQAARTLLEIEADERNITKAIIKLLYTQLDEETHRLVAWYLGKIIPARSETIKALIECLSSPISQSVRCQAVVSLGQVGERNGEAVSALISLLQSSVDEYLRREVVFSLRKIAFDNLNAIRALEKLVDETRDEETCFQAACALNQISTDKSKGIEALKKLTSSRQTFFMQFGAAMALCRQLPGDINIIKILIELLLDNRRSPYSLIENFGTRYVVTQITITDFLKPLVTTEQLPIIINTIKSYKSRQDAVSRALYRSFGSDIIWHYAQNLTYDKFYQACRGE